MGKSTEFPPGVRALPSEVGTADHNRLTRPRDSAGVNGGCTGFPQAVLNSASSKEVTGSDGVGMGANVSFGNPSGLAGMYCIGETPCDAVH